MSKCTCLTYWFPKLVAAGLPVPRTEIVDAGDDWPKMLGLFDGPKHDTYTPAVAMVDRVTVEIRAAAARLGGYPVFLRTGQGSGKHNWKHCCDLRSADAVSKHVAGLIEWSECVDFMGLSWRFWCVREMLPVKPVAVLPAYSDMPLVREVRAFVRAGKVVCVHPYWPADSIRQGFGMVYMSDDEIADPLNESTGPKTWRAGRYPVPDNLNEIIEASFLPMYLTGWATLLEQVAAVFADDGAWSVDVLETDRGWFVTDMAEANRSFHWEGCEHAEAMRKAK